jgi:hypothetical protein
MNYLTRGEKRRRDSQSLGDGSQADCQSSTKSGRLYTTPALMLDWNFNTQSASISMRSDV